MIQQQAKFTTFSAPQSVNGVACGAVALFNPSITYRQTISADIGTWEILSVTAVGGGLFDIRVVPGIQYSDVDMGTAGQRFNMVYGWKGGGNCCRTSEDMRGISHANPRALGGPDAADRLQVGDGFVLVQGAKEFPAQKVTLADSHHYAPVSTDWRPTDTTGAIAYASPATESFTFDASGDGGRVYIELDADPLWQTPVLIADDSGVLTELSRKVFEYTDGIETVEDPNYYPPDATFSTLTAEYWIDPVTYAVRIGEGTVLYGDTLYLDYWVRAIGPITSTAGKPVVIEDAGSGYGGTSDSIGIALYGTATDFDVSLDIEHVETGGALEWRPSVLAGGKVVALKFSATGITAEVYRATNGGSVAAFDATAITLSLPFQVRMTKVDDAFDVYARQNSGASWTWCGTTALAGVETDTDGVLSVGTWGGGVRFTDATAREWQRVTFSGDTDSRISVLRRATSAEAGFVLIAKAAPEAITEVFNITADVTMTNSTTAARNNYRVVGDSLLFYMSTTGDRVRVTHAAPASPPAGTGRPPRTFNQLNAATLDPDDPELATSTTDPAENHLNWDDRIRILWEGPGDFPGVAGDTFKGVRFGVFDPSNPPDMDYSIDGGANWSALTSGDYVALWWQGAVFLAQSFLDTLEAGARLSLRATGKRMRWGGLHDAETMYNEHKRLVEGLDNLEVVVDYGFGESHGIGGAAYYGLGSTERVCLVGGGSDIANVVLGMTGVHETGVPERLPLVANLPYWRYDFDANALVYVNSTSGVWYNESNPPPVLSCSDGMGGFVDHQITFIEGNKVINLSPFISSPGGIYFGCQEALLLDSNLMALFHFEPLTMVSTGILGRLPAGTEIISATLDVKFVGLKTNSWRLYLSTNNSSILEEVREVNGTTVLHIVNDVELINVSAPPDTDGASIGFVAVGVRINTANIEDYQGALWEYPNNEYVALGGGGSTAIIGNGDWEQVDVTHAVNALVGLADSEYAHIEFWPTPGAGLIGGDVNTLEKYVLGLFGSIEVDYTNDPVTGAVDTRTFDASAQYLYATSMAFGNLVVRFRLDGAVREWRVMPVKPPRFV
jgi:hypothetical protein